MDISILSQGSQKSAEFLLLPSLTISWKLRILKRTILSHCSAYKLYRSVIEYRQSVELCWVVPISKICDWNDQVRFFLCLGAFCLFVWFVVICLFVFVLNMSIISFLYCWEYIWIFWNELKKHMFFYTFRWIFCLDVCISTNVLASEGMHFLIYWYLLI